MKENEQHFFRRSNKENSISIVHSAISSHIEGGPSNVDRFYVIYKRTYISIPDSHIEIVGSYPRVVKKEAYLLSGGIGSYAKEILKSRPDLQSCIHNLDNGNDIAKFYRSQDYHGKITKRSVLAFVT
jgi:hypothetical protein